MGKDVKNIITEIDKEIAKFPKVQGAGNVYLSSKLNHVFMQAEKNAEQFKDDFVSVEHLFMALIDEKGIRLQKFSQITESTKTHFLKH